MYNKYFTLSFDDGVTQDLRFIKLLKKHGLYSCTFNINTGLLGNGGEITFPDGYKVPHVKLTADDVRGGVYEGFEIAVHSYTHPALSHISTDEVKEQITKDEALITEYSGTAPVGMAYPGGNYYTEETIDTILSSSNMRYARTVTSTHGFSLPERFMEWHPTCHILDEKAEELALSFIEAKATDSDLLFYVWGHTYEFDWHDRWDSIDRFLSLIANKKDIIYMTGRDIYERFSKSVPSK